MKFMNRYTSLYAFIVLITAGLYFAAPVIWLKNGNESTGYWMFFVYLLILFGAAFIISRRDEYQAYGGFNYHLITYVICNGVPLLYVALHILPVEVAIGIKYVMLFWGIGLLMHFLLYMFSFRKRAIRSYEKEDVFK